MEETGVPGETTTYSKSLASFLHAMAGMRTRPVGRDREQSVVAPLTTCPSGQAPHEIDQHQDESKLVFEDRWSGGIVINTWE